MEETIRDLIETLSQNLLEGTEENHENLTIDGVPAEITTEGCKNTKLELHRNLSVIVKIRQNVTEIIMNFKSV
jgi:hypothetical protein